MRILCIGAGTIGLSWARLFATHGHDVLVVDPRPDLDAAVAGLDVPPEVLARIATADDRAAAMAGVDLVQESGPERLAFKRQVVAEFATAAPAHALLLSSSSALRSSDFTDGVDDHVAARVAVGHPFNPPHVMPLVEVVPGRRTSPDTVQRALEFYRGLGRRPVALHREVPGHVGNRLQKAVLNEAMGLVLDGVVDVADIDAVMKDSLGLRWAAVGPIEGMALGGGAGGVQGLVELLRESFAAIELHDPAWQHDTLRPLYEQADATYGRPVPTARAARRDAIQAAILEARARIESDGADPTSATHPTSATGPADPMGAGDTSRH